MKFDQNYTVKINTYKTKNKKTERKDETGQKIPVITTQFIKETKKEINLKGIIQENKPLTIKQMIVKFSAEQIQELGKEGTYLNNADPIDLQKLAEAQAAYKKAIKDIQLKEQQKKQQQNQTNTTQEQPKTTQETPKEENK